MFIKKRTERSENQHKTFIGSCFLQTSKIIKKGEKNCWGCKSIIKIQTKKKRGYNLS